MLKKERSEHLLLICRVNSVRLEESDTSLMFGKYCIHCPSNLTFNSWMRCLEEGCPDSASKISGNVELTAVSRWPFHLDRSHGQDAEVNKSQPLHNVSMSRMLPPTSTIRHRRRNRHMLPFSCNSDCCRHLYLLRSSITHPLTHSLRG